MKRERGGVAALPPLHSVRFCLVLFSSGSKTETDCFLSGSNTGLSENAVKILTQIHHSSNGNDYLNEICTYLSFLIEHNSEYLVSPVVNVLEYAEATAKIKHYKNTVLPTLNVSSECDVVGWSISKEDSEILSKRTKVFDEIKRLQDVCDVRRYNCEKIAAAFSSFIDFTEQQHKNVLNQPQK